MSENNVNFLTFLPQKKIFSSEFFKLNENWHAKSLYKSRAGRHFYGIENEIWAGFGPIGNTEKKSLGRL